MPAVSLVLSILALIGIFYNPIPFTTSIYLGMPGLFGLIFGIVAIVLAIKGKKACLAAGKPAGMCTAALVMGIIAAAVGGAEYAYCVICTARVEGALNDAASNIGSLI